MGLPVLHTIVFRHFCESARWGLQLSHRQFIERGHLPAMNMVTAPKKTIKGTSTPFLLKGADQIGPIEDEMDSWAVLSTCHGPPIPEDLKEILNKTLGPAVRTIVYDKMLYTPDIGKLIAGANPEVLPIWHRWLWSCGMGYLCQVAIQKLLVKDPEHVRRSQVRLDEAVAKVEAKLAEGKSSPFVALPDGSPCMATVAVCALFAPIVSPPLYGYGAMTAPPVEAMQPSVQEFTAKYRGTELGKFVLKTYEEWRVPKEAKIQTPEMLKSNM
eukprot:gene23980-9555_t